MSGLMYCTSDRVGEVSGGGQVTAQEIKALCEFSEEMTFKKRDPLLSSISVFSRDNLGNDKPEPWRWDDTLASRQDFPYVKPRLCHMYSGSFPKTAAMLKDRGCKLTWTIAAHDVKVSREEHEKLGIDFCRNLPHLTDPKLWKRYIEGYRLADVIVCPSSVAEATVRRYGPDFEGKVFRVIPHGCHLPKEEDVKPLPSTFVVGYMGALGADKGVRYLLEAWKKLDYKDGSLLVLAGRDSNSPMARWLIDKYGGGNIHLMGWVDNVADFYNRLTCYIQPSVTEGFGIEVLEALSYGRPIICSRGAGAVDTIRRHEDFLTSFIGREVPPCNVDSLVEDIARVKGISPSYGSDVHSSWHKSCRAAARNYSWDRVRKMYRDVWAEVLQ